MKGENNSLPAVNQRIKNLIDSDYNGSVRAFAMALGLPDSQKINRLFNIDGRNGRYPKPSIDILTLISNTFDISLEWIQTGSGSKNKKSDVANEENPYLNETNLNEETGETLKLSDMETNLLMELLKGSKSQIDQFLSQQEKMLSQQDELIAIIKNLTSRRDEDVGSEKKPGLRLFPEDKGELESPTETK